MQPPKVEEKKAVKLEERDKTACKRLEWLVLTTLGSVGFEDVYKVSNEKFRDGTPFTMKTKQSTVLLKIMLSGDSRNFTTETGGDPVTELKFIVKSLGDNFGLNTLFYIATITLECIWDLREVCAQASVKKLNLGFLIGFQNFLPMVEPLRYESTPSYKKIMEHLEKVGEEKLTKKIDKDNLEWLGKAVDEKGRASGETSFDGRQIRTRDFGR